MKALKFLSSSKSTSTQHLNKMAGVDECNAILWEHLYDFQINDKQYDVVQSILNGEDTVGILPTGYGKSLCYFIPPLILDKVCFFLLIFMLKTSSSKTHSCHFFFVCIHNIMFLVKIG